MVKMLAILGFGLIMFGAAAAGSWFLQTKVLKTAAAAGAHEEETADAETFALGGSTLASAEDHHAPESASLDESLPVAVRPRDMSVEELLRYGKGITEREQQVRQQEELLQQRRVHQQLALQDIEGERREIDGLHVQIGEQLKAAEKLIEKMQDAREQLKQDQTKADDNLKKMRADTIEIDGQRLDNTKRLSQWIQGMEPEKAAVLFTEMANSGEMDTAIQLISNFEEREAAKILSAIKDPKLVTELIEQFRNLKRPPKTAARP